MRAADLILTHSKASLRLSLLASLRTGRETVAELEAHDLASDVEAEAFRRFARHQPIDINEVQQKAAYLLAHLSNGGDVEPEALTDFLRSLTAPIPH